MKPFYEQSPPVVPFAEVDRTIHGFHPSFLKPFPRCVEEKVGSLLIVDTIEKAYSACGLSITFVSIFFIYKRGYTTYQFTIVVFQYPADNFSMAESFILFRIKYFVDILVQWANPSGNAFIQLNMRIDELCRRFFIIKCNQLHRDLLEVQK
jgi:hypothetical protein